MRAKSLFLGAILVLTTQAWAAPSWVQDTSYSSGSGAPAAAPITGIENSNTTKRQPRNTRDISPFSPRSHNISAHLGQVFLMGDLSGKYPDNLGWRINYTYGVSDIFGFDASIGYSDHGNGKFGLATGLLGLRTNLVWYDRIIPYLVFGLGFFRPAYQVALPGGGTQDVAPFLFGVHLGPGVTLQLSKMFFFGASVEFHNMFGTTRSGAVASSDPGGGAFISFLINGGISL